MKKKLITKSKAVIVSNTKGSNIINYSGHNTPKRSRYFMKILDRLAKIIPILVFFYAFMFAQAITQKVKKIDLVLNKKDTTGYFREQKYPGSEGSPAACEVSTRLPNTVMPVLAVWFWREDMFNPDVLKKFIDTMSIHSPYNILAASVRLPEREITKDAVHDQMKLAAEYAKTKGISLVADLDVRCARQTFATKYPDELQEMLRLQEVELSGKDSVEVTVKSLDLHDHYTAKPKHYISIRGSLLRVYSYELTPHGIEKESLIDITNKCVAKLSSKDSVVVKIPTDNKNRMLRACVMVSFTHFTPDVFAPHIMEFQREIIQRYADVPLVGVFKDEWGFPPCHNPNQNDFWYSKYRAQDYAVRTGGRELLCDCLLMYLGIRGQESERQMAINHFREMSWQRNGALEDDYYHTVKKVFGPLAVVETHPTWWPYPGQNEYKKNGLDWWVVTRDWAQTDEDTPFAVRTALAKKWGSPIWYNMYYGPNFKDYQNELWSSALGGGRINYHPLYKTNIKRNTQIELLRGDLMQGESRVRLLNYISKSPLDCQVAVIFGHACTMNWAGPAFDDVGMELVNGLWREGIPTDLIPSSEIENGNLHLDKNGRIWYGSQSYSAVVLYHPEFEKVSTSEFFSKAKNGSTSMFRIGDWTHNFNGQSFNGNAELPGSMVVEEGSSETIKEIQEILNKRGIKLQSAATRTIGYDNLMSYGPPSTGICHLIDGTVIQVAGTSKVSGDPIYSTIRVQNHNVFFDAVGVAAVRLNDDGQVQAIVAGGLKSFKSGNFEINLNNRIDIALWINDKGKWEGVIQGWDGNVPRQLLKVTKNWVRINLPSPLPHIE